MMMIYARSTDWLNKVRNRRSVNVTLEKLSAKLLIFKLIIAMLRYFTRCIALKLSATNLLRLQDATLSPALDFLLRIFGRLLKLKVCIYLWLSRILSSFLPVPPRGNSRDDVISQRKKNYGCSDRFIFTERATSNLGYYCSLSRKKNLIFKF
jgi:hypothetical protein